MNSRVVHAIRPWCIRLKRMDVQTLSIVNVAEHDREQTFATTQFCHSNDQFFSWSIIRKTIYSHNYDYCSDTIKATAKMNTIRKKGAKWSVRIGHSMNIISSRVPLHTIDCPSHSCLISWHFTTPLLVGAPNLQGGRTKTKFTKLWQSATYRLPSSGQIG